MQPNSDTANNDQGPRLLDLLPDPGQAGFGQAMLRLAQAAAAQHRMEHVAEGTEPWVGLEEFCFYTQDKAEHGSPADTRSARDRGPVTTEGDR